MPYSERVRLGVIGSGWISDKHAKAIAAIREAELIACADYPRDRGGRPGRGEALAQAHRIAFYFDDYRRMLERPEIEAVVVGLPNSLHAEVVEAALDAGKHVLVEKPMCLRLSDADRLVRLAKEKQLALGYAEELCFCPKFVRAKALVDRGAVGRLFWIKQTEVHAGPYSEWFFDPKLAGGGALMDMGCHSIEYVRWMYGKAKVKRVTAHLHTYVHRQRKDMVDDQCVVHLELEDGRSALIEAGWTLQGGMDSLAHLQGSEGVIKIDLLRDNGIEMFSTQGVSSEEILPGWSRPDYEWLWQNGYPQEMSEFARAIREGRVPSESGEDGRAVLEIIWAAYASARERRTIELPYDPPPHAKTPVQLWMDRS
jgi:myo-inositol 2-dehydrogenase / D-chiro-inositol 1-dehydrogenase